MELDRKTVDALLTGMLQSSEDVSDLLFISGKPPLVEIHGRLSEFSIDGPGFGAHAKAVHRTACRIDH